MRAAGLRGARAPAFVRVGLSHVAHARVLADGVIASVHIFARGSLRGLSSSPSRRSRRAFAVASAAIAVVGPGVPERADERPKGSRDRLACAARRGGELPRASGPPTSLHLLFKRLNFDGGAHFRRCLAWRNRFNHHRITGSRLPRKKSHDVSRGPATLARKPRGTTQRHARERCLLLRDTPPPLARLHHEGPSRRRPSTRSQPPALSGAVLAGSAGHTAMKPPRCTRRTSRRRTRTTSP